VPTNLDHTLHLNIRPRFIILKTRTADVLAALEPATGEKWSVRYLELGKFIEEHKIKADIVQRVVESQA
jgi:hypothetical protein